MTNRLSGFLVGTLSVAASCSTTITTGELPLSPADLRPAAAAAITPSGAGRGVFAALTIENTSSDDQPIAWGVDCGGSGPFDLRAYRNVGGSLVLVWRSDALPRTLGCPTVLIQRTLKPGDRAVIQRTIDVAAILGDSLPAGSYTFTVHPSTTPPIDSELPAGTLFLTTGVVAGPGVVLDGVWHGAANGVALSLDLRWFADSVVGGGTFTVSGDNTLGCGGITLRGTGAVTFTAHRTHDSVQGSMAFSNGWVPSFAAVLADTATLGGAFGSIDAGPCPITLTRGPV